jgi:hypothetical protein
MASPNPWTPSPEKLGEEYGAEVTRPEYGQAVDL